MSLIFFDNDGWFILNNGRYIMDYGVPMKNPFTWMEGLDIIIQQWLWSVVTYTSFKIAGTWGLAAICVILYGLSLFLFVKIGKLHRISIGRTMIFGTIMLLMMFGYLNIRPTFVTIVLLLWQVYLLEAYKLDGKWHRLLWLIMISFLEINFHAAIWTIHFVFLLPYLVPEIKTLIVDFQIQKMNRLPLLAIIVPMFLVGFLNPYGIDGMMYLFKSYGDELKSAGIIELMAPATDNIGLLVATFMVIAIIWVTIHRKDRLQSSLFYILCGTALLSLSHVRNSVYFLLGFMIFGIQILNTEKINIENIHKKSSMVLSVAVFLLIFTSISSIYKNIKEASTVEDNTYTPIKAIEYLEKNKISHSTRLYTNFNPGGYVQWCGYKSFMEPRPELYFKTLNGKIDAFKDYNKAKKTTDPEKLKKFMEKYDFEWMIVNNNEPIRMYLDLTGAGESVVNGNGYQLYQIK